MIHSHQFTPKSKNVRFYGTEFRVQSTPFKAYKHLSNVLLPLQYTFRYRIETGSLTTYKYRNNKLY